MSEHRYISLKDILRNQPIQAELKLEPENKGKNSHSNLVSSKGSCSDSSYESPGGEDEDNGDVRRKDTKARVKKKNKGKCTRLPSMRMSKSDNPNLLYTEFGGSCSSEDELKDLSLEMRNLSWEERTLRSNVISQSEEEANDNEEEEEEANN